MADTPMNPTKNIGDDATATFENDPKFTEPMPGSEGSSDNVEQQMAMQMRDTDDVADSDEEIADPDDEDEDEDVDDEEEDDEDELEDEEEDDQEEVSVAPQRYGELETERLTATAHFAAQVMAAREAMHGGHA
jgi:hypothetical protein